MDTSTHIPASAKATCDALCTALGVKGPLRLLPQPPTNKPHILIKRDIPKDGEPHDVKPDCARFTFVAGKRINVNKGAVLLFGIELPVPEGARRTHVVNLETYLLEGDLSSSQDEGKGKPRDSSQVKKARNEARKNIVALPPRMRKCLGEKPPASYFAAAHAETNPLAQPTTSPSAFPPRAFATTAVQTDDPPPKVTTPRVSSHFLAPPSSSYHLDDARKSPMQLPSPVSADHARETPTSSLAPLEDELADHYEMERSLSPMDLESDVSSPEVSPAAGQVALPEVNVAAALLAMPPVATADANRTDSKDLYPQAATAVSSHFTSANVLETPTLPSIEARGLSLSPPRRDSPELPRTETSEPVEVIIERQQEVQVKQELIQASGLFSPLNHTHQLRAEPVPESGSQARNNNVPSEPRAMRPEISPVWAAGRAPPNFVKSAQASLDSTWDESAPYIPTLNNPSGVRPSSNASYFPRAPPTGPRALAATTAPQKLVEGSKWSPARGLLAASAPLSSSSSSSMSTSSSAPISVSSQPTSPAHAPVVSSDDGNSTTILLNSLPSPPPPETAPPPPIVECPQPPPLPSPPMGQGPATEWKRIDYPVGPPTMNNASPSIIINTPPVYATQPISNPKPFEPAATSSTHASLNTANNMIIGTPKVQVAQTTSNPTSLKSGEPSTTTASNTSATPITIVIPPAPIAAHLTSNHTSETRTFSPNPRKRPYESSVKTIEVSLTSPSVSSGALLNSKAHSINCAPQASSSRPSATMMSFLKSHLPQPASSQMTHPLPHKSVLLGSDTSSAIDVDQPSDCESVHSSSAPGQKSKRKNRRSKKSKNKRKRGPRGHVEEGQIIEGPVPPVSPVADWPTTGPKFMLRLVPNVGSMPGASQTPAVKKILFNADGTRVAILCDDHTLRIWLNESLNVPPGEIARLNHKQSLVTACWVDQRRILVLTKDGALIMWTRSSNGNEEWKPARLLTVPELSAEDEAYCLAYAPDRIAVSMPSGVKTWLLTNGNWLQQRDIVRGGVTAIRFVYDGAVLIGGCRDGVMWYCEVPNGTLRAYAFVSFRNAIRSIELHPSGSYLLVSQDGGRCYLITLRANENRGTVERTYTSEVIQEMSAPRFSGVFAMSGQAVLYGTVNDCVPVWNRKKGYIVYGLKHNKGDIVQAAATFDDVNGVGGSMITGTSKGELFWWPPPAVHEPTPHVDTADSDESRKRQKVE